MQQEAEDDPDEEPEFEEIPDLDDEDLTDTINNKKRQRRNSYETLGRKIY